MHETHIRTDIQRALSNFTDENLAENTNHLMALQVYPPHAQVQRRSSHTSVDIGR